MLTPREIEVLKLIALGLNNVEISKKLYYSRGAIKSDVSSILAKLKVENRIQAAVKGVYTDLV